MNILLELSLLLFEQRTHIPTRPPEFDGIFQRGWPVGVRDEAGLDGGFALFYTSGFELDEYVPKVRLAIGRFQS
jgi:hypothetical protein